MLDSRARQGPQGAPGAVRFESRRRARQISARALRQASRNGAAGESSRHASFGSRRARHREILRPDDFGRRLVAPAHAAPRLRDAPAGRWRGSARDSGTARARTAFDDAKVHSGLAHGLDGGLRSFASQSQKVTTAQSVTTRVRIAKPADAGRVRSAYESWDYTRKIAPDDTIWLAENAGELVGIVRIAAEFGTLVLRGMRIAEGWQRRGIGSLMLLAVDKWLDERKCYCVPYAHLGKFYCQIGF